MKIITFLHAAYLLQRGLLMRPSWSCSQRPAYALLSVSQSLRPLSACSFPELESRKSNGIWTSD